MLSPKQIVPICFAIFSFVFSAPSFADPDIAPSASTADCKYNPLETYSGTSNLQADWTANEIGLRWYNTNTLMEVDSTSSDCTYDDDLVPPSTIPTRTGYTFTGWKVRPTMEFTTIPTNVNGTNRWAIGWYNNANYCWYDTNTGSAWNVACDSDTTYSKELQTHEWKVKFSHGDVYGMAGCSTTSGTYAVAGNPTIGSGQYCWCKATGYKATNASEVSGPLSALSWVFAHGYGSAAHCAQRCANRCALGVEYYSAFRGALFAGSGN